MSQAPATSIKSQKVDVTELAGVSAFLFFLAVGYFLISQGFQP